MNSKSIVHIHIIAALIVLLFIYVLVGWWIPPLTQMTADQRILMAAKLQAFIVLPLLIGITLTVHARYSSEELILGYKSNNTAYMQFLQAYNKNTLEQSVLHALALFGFCAAVPSVLLKWAFAQVCAFLLGRFLFFIGYYAHPTKRLMGFAIGYYPAAFAIGVSCFFHYGAELILKI